MFIHGLVAHFFLGLDSILLSGCTSLFIHTPTEGHLGCFQVLAVMNKAAINIHVQDLCRCKFLVHLGKYQGAQLLDHMVRECLIL